MRTAGALTAAAFLIFLLAAGLRAQETQAAPAPVIQAAPAQTQPDAQKAAPVERRASRPTASSPHLLVGPVSRRCRHGVAVQCPIAPSSQPRQEQKSHRRLGIGRLGWGWRSS